MIERRWWPPMLWAAVILIGTSWPRIQLPPVEGGDKLLHALVYTVLGVLTTRAALMGSRRAATLALVVGGIAIFGALDELHQAWIPGRYPSMADWWADALGGTAGSLASWVSRSTRAVA